MLYIYIYLYKCNKQGIIEYVISYTTNSWIYADLYYSYEFYNFNHKSIY